VKRDLIGNGVQVLRVLNKKGFTLLEIMLVVVILSVLAAIAVPRLTASSESAREKADITTGSEIKSALDRYQIENGSYPKPDELRAANGEVTGPVFIPEYIKKLNSSVTQQNAVQEKRGFGIVEIEQINDSNPQHLIMIYLSTDGSAAEVKVFNKNFSEVLWSSV